jgi:SAM-dependent methyltransferase
VAAADLTRRATEPERLDEGVPEEEALASLADLRFVNRWLGNRRPVVDAVRPYLTLSARPTLLDVGCGSADLPAAVARAAPGLLAVGADIKLLHVRQAPRSVRTVVADVRALPFPPRSFDVVMASLFLHHFDAGEAPRILRTLYAVARRALVINDLRRARLPYVFGRAAFPLLFRSRVSVDDGLTSIRRGFTEPELRAAFAEAGIDVHVRRTWPYRLLAVAEKAAG